MEEAKYRIRDVIDNFEYDELLKMKKDLDNGGLHLNGLITKKLKEKEKVHEAYCSVCQTKIEMNNIHNYTLVFGPHDFRKKATFCATDCLRYFLKQLDDLKQSKKTKIEVKKDDEGGELNGKSII